MTDPVWVLVGLVAGWMFAPAVLLLALAIWRLLFPLKPFVFVPHPDPDPPAAPPPLTDQEYRRLMTLARLMRQKQKRGLEAK